MSFKPGDILYFNEYQFTDKNELKKHFALVLLPETATKYQNSIFCCVITSKPPKKWGLELLKVNYPCFNLDSYACFDRKDLVSKTGLNEIDQPRGVLSVQDFKKAHKILKTSLFVLDDTAWSPFLRGIILYHWKKSSGQIV